GRRRRAARARAARLARQCRKLRAARAAPCRLPRRRARSGRPWFQRFSLRGFRVSPLAGRRRCDRGCRSTRLDALLADRSFARRGDRDARRRNVPGAHRAARADRRRSAADRSAGRGACTARRGARPQTRARRADGKSLCEPRAGDRGARGRLLEGRARDRGDPRASIAERIARRMGLARRSAPEGAFGAALHERSGPRVRRPRDRAGAAVSRDRKPVQSLARVRRDRSALPITSDRAARRGASSPSRRRRARDRRRDSPILRPRLTRGGTGRPEFATIWSRTKWPRVPEAGRRPLLRRETMKVFEIVQGSTSLDGLRLAERPKPSAGPGQVLVRIRAVSLNYRDLAVVQGKYFGGAVPRNLIPLSDGAGEVEAVGDGVTAFAPGDRVVATFTQGSPPAALGSPLDGTLAEHVVFPESGLLKIPEHLSFEEAATLPCAGVTAWNALM